MNARILFALLLVSFAAPGCGGSSGPPEPPPFPGATAASKSSTSAQAIIWPPGVDMVTKQRVGMDIAFADAIANTFPAVDYPAVASITSAAATLRNNPTIPNAAPLEAAIEAFGENLTGPDEEKLQQATSQAMMQQMQSAMVDYMVQTTTALLTALEAEFPTNRYPQFADFQSVAQSALANPTPEAGDRLEAAMETFKNSLSASDRQRADDIMDAVELQQAQTATDQGNEVAVQMWYDIAEDQKDQIWTNLDARISKVAYNELADGVTYDRAVAILEREGGSMGRSNSTFNGVKTTSEAFQWAWENRDGTHGKIEAYFINDQLRAKVYYDNL